MEMITTEHRRATCLLLLTFISIYEAAYCSILHVGFLSATNLFAEFAFGKTMKKSEILTV